MKADLERVLGAVLTGDDAGLQVDAEDPAAGIVLIDPSVACRSATRGADEGLRSPVPWQAGRVQDRVRLPKPFDDVCRVA